MMRVEFHIGSRVGVVKADYQESTTPPGSDVHTEWGFELMGEN